MNEFLKDFEKLELLKSSANPNYSSLINKGSVPFEEELL